MGRGESGSVSPKLGRPQPESSQHPGHRQPETPRQRSAPLMATHSVFVLGGIQASAPSPMAPEQRGPETCGPERTLVVQMCVVPTVPGVWRCPENDPQHLSGAAARPGERRHRPEVVHPELAPTDKKAECESALKTRQISRSMGSRQGFHGHNRPGGGIGQSFPAARRVCR